jgi:hypothetical protein
MVKGFSPINDSYSYIYLAALKPKSTTVYYIRVIEERHQEIMDFLLDNSCKLVKLAEWRWRMQATDKRHPEWDKNGVVYEITRTVDFNPFESK